MVETFTPHFHSRAGRQSLLDWVFRALAEHDLLKHWPVIALITLAVILLLSPGIIGRLAEKSVDENLGWVEEENEDIVIESEGFDRGWFSSEGRYRVSLRAGRPDGLAGPDSDADPGGVPALIIDTRIDHGLVPLTSMGRERGTLMPGLASTVSTLQIDRGDGELVDLPGRVYSFIDLTGDATIRYVMEPGAERAGNVKTEWSGADLTIVSSPDRRRLSIDGSIQAVSVESYGVATRIGEVTIDAEQDRSRYKFGIGALSLRVDSVTVRSAGATDGGFSELVLDMQSELDGDRVDGAVSLELDDVVVADIGTVDLATQLKLTGLSADSIAVIAGAWRKLYGIGRPATAAELDAVYPAIERELARLAARGGRIDIENLRVALPQGDWQSSLTVDWPESDAEDTFSLPSLLLRMHLEAKLDLSAPLYDFLIAQIPDAESLLAMGVLVRNGDRYEMDAELSSGVLKINGAPMPIPLGLPR